MLLIWEQQTLKLAEFFYFLLFTSSFQRSPFPLVQKGTRKKPLQQAHPCTEGKKKENSLKIKVWSATQKKTNKQANKLHKTKLNSKNKTKNNKKPPNLSHHKKIKQSTNSPTAPLKKYPIKSTQDD